MGSWKLVGWGGVCGLGALSFLQIVAQEVERIERTLAAKDARIKKKYERQRREGSDQGEPPVIQAVSVGSGPADFVVRNGHGTG